MLIVVLDCSVCNKIEGKKKKIDCLSDFPSKLGLLLLQGVMVQAKDILGLSPFQDNMGRAPDTSLSHRMRELTSNLSEGGGWVVDGEPGAGKGGYRSTWPEPNRGISELVGTEERPFPCPYCPLSFKRRYTMQEHVRIHMGSRPYACRSCGKTFTQRSSLLKHVRVRVCQKHVLQN